MSVSRSFRTRKILIMAQVIPFTLEDLENLHWLARNTSVTETDPEVLKQFSVYIDSTLNTIDLLLEMETKKESCILDQYTALNNKFQETKHRFMRARSKNQTSFSQNYSMQLIILNRLISLFQDSYNQQFKRVEEDDDHVD